MKALDCFGVALLRREAGLEIDPAQPIEPAVVLPVLKARAADGAAGWVAICRCFGGFRIDVAENIGWREVGPALFEGRATSVLAGTSRYGEAVLPARTVRVLADDGRFAFVELDLTGNRLIS